MDDKAVMILHIGMHKTGSTSLQGYLAGHPGALARAGYVYPRAGRHADQHGVLPGAMLHEHRALPADARRSDPASVLAQIAAEVPRGMRTILSSEVFWELLLFESGRFLDLVDQIRDSWNVHVVYFARQPHEKSWSTVKHMAREGHAFDPSAAYRDDLRMTCDAEARLRADVHDVTRIEYDGSDTVLQMLSFLARPDTAAMCGSTDGQVQALAQMAERRRRQVRGQRTNRDFRNPYSAAVTLVVSESLARSGADEPVAGLARLYPPLFRLPLLHWDRAGLPDDSGTGDRVRGADAGSPVFSEAEVRSVRDRLTKPAVRGLARAVRSADELDSVVDALDSRLSR